MRQRRSAALTSLSHLPRPRAPAPSPSAGPRCHHAAAHGDPHLPGLGAVERARLDVLGAGKLTRSSSCCCCH